MSPQRALMAGPGEDFLTEEILAQALGTGVASMTDPALHGRALATHSGV